MSTDAGITIKLTRNPPLAINGGITRWLIHTVPQGKNGAHLVVACDCLDDPSRNINLASGRRREVHVEGPYTAEAGSVLALIFAKLVRLGYAERLPFQAYHLRLQRRGPLAAHD